MLSTGDVFGNDDQTQQEQWALNLVKQEDTIRIDARLEADLANRRLAAKRRRKDADEDVSSSFARNSAKHCVYKIETLACISREEESDDEDKTNVTKRRNVSCDAVVSPGGFCIVVASQIHLLDSSCAEHKATINLDCDPELVAFSRNSSFLVVGDSLGTIHFIHVESKNIVFSQEICPENDAVFNEDDISDNERTSRNAFNVLCFASSDSMETEELFVVLRNNVLFRFSNIDVAKLQRAISEQNFALAGEVKSSIKIERLDLGTALSSSLPFSIRDIAVHYDSQGSNAIVAGIGKYPISCWRRALEDDNNPNPKMVLSDGVNRLLKGVGIKKVQLSLDGNYMVVLNENGGLSIWQFSSLIMLRSYPDVALTDFNIMPCTTNPANLTDVDSMLPQISVVVLTSARSEETNDVEGVHQNRCLQIISLPGYEITHSVEVASACWLVKSQAKAEDKNDTVHFVEGRGRSSTPDGSIKELYLRSLSETVPLTRFQQLIDKQRFEEATEFAEQFELDKQAVLKAKLSHALEKMAESCNSAGLPDKIDIETIIADINNIKDLSFAVDFCLQAVVPSYSATYRLLSYARSLVQDSESTDGTVISSAVITRVHQAVRRLGTWQLIEYNSNKPLEPTLESLDTNDEGLVFDGSAWQRFRTADMVVEMRNLIGRGRFRMAIVLWRRHYLEENLLNHIQDILVEIGEDVPASEYIPWLRNEVLPYIQNTDDRAKISIWVEQRTRVIEARDKKPHNALDVVRLLEVSTARESEIREPNEGSPSHFSALVPATPARYVERTVLLAHTAVYSTFGVESSLSSTPGSELKKQLEDLVYLWDEHNFKLSLADYSQSTPRGIALDLLDCVAAPELLKDAIDTHFSKYVERVAGLNYDDLLVEYCMEVMDGAAGLGMSLANAPWEARVMAVLGSIRDGDSRLDVIVEIMRRTPVPWSDSVQKIIDDALAQPGLRRADELREQYRLMQLKNMLIRYGITVFNISDLSLAKGLVSHILGRSDLPEAMNDALQVVNAYHHLSKEDSYVLRMQNLCEANRSDLVLQLLKSMVDTEKDGDSAEPLPRIVYSSGQETLTWLLEIMEGLREFGVSYEQACTKDYDPLAVQTFNWAICAAFKITKFLMNGNEEEACAHLHIATPQLLDDLSRLQSLYQEYNVILLPSELKAKAIRQKIVRNMMKVTSVGEQSKGSLDTLHTAVYRMADILRINRFDMKGILAEEATLRGDAREASLLCKEMFEKQPDAETAKMLRRIAFLMSQHSMENCAKVYKSNQIKFRLTNRIQLLCQEAMLICNEGLLGDCLDEYKSYEIQNAIFAQCESGDYGSLVDTLEIDVERSGSGSSSSQPVLSCHSVQTAKAIQPTDAAPVLKDKYAAVLFADQYFENGLVMDTSTAMRSVGKFVVQRIGQSDPMLVPRSLLNTVSRKGKAKSEDDGDALFYSAANNLSSYLKDSRTYQAAIRVFQRAQEQVIRNGLQVQIDALEAQQYCELLEICVQKVLSSRYIDNSLALAYMISLPLDKAFSAFRAGLSTVGSDYHRLLRFSGIGMSCATVWKQRTFFVDCKQLRSNARWWHQLKLLDIPFDDGQFRNCKDGEYQRKLVPMLLEKTSQDLITVLEFSRAYHIEDDFVLLEFIKTSILSGKSDSYENQVTGIIEDVVNKSKLLTLFSEQCIQRISPYDYERLQFVQKHIQVLERSHEGAKKGLIVLDILKNYTRTRLPDAAELSNARRILDNIDVTIRPDDMEANLKRFPASLRRLPFHGIVEEPWEVLKPELSEDTIPRLLPLTIPLDMHPDKFHVTVIDNLISQQKQSPSQEAPVSLSPGKPIAAVGTISGRIKFSDFRGLILKIRDTELAISSAKYVADVFPCGTDKIQALKTAVTVAEKWYQKITTGGQTDDQIPEMAERAHVAVGRLRESLARAETEHQLRKNGFDQFIELVSQPLELVCQLYAQKSEEALVKKEFPDLHLITSDVARRHNLDVDKIRQYLLTSWLTQDGEPSLSGEEGNLPSARMQPIAVGSDQGYAGKETQLQMKILYLLRVGAVEKNVAFLLNFAYQQRASQKVTTLMRVRSLSVLFQLASPKEIARVHNYPEVRAYLQMLLYLADFEEIRISQTLKEFNGCSKDALARSLWVAHSDEPKVVQLICNMCLDYRIYDTTLWENALLRLLKFGKIHYLLGLLEQVSSVPMLAQMKSLPHLWNKVLLGCLSPSDAGDVGAERSITMRTQVCLLLQKCPFLPELDLPQFMDNFEGLAKDAAGTVEALRMLSFIPTAAGVRERAQKLVAKLGASDLILALNVMHPSKVKLDDTETGISKAIILHVIYAQIEKHNGHRELFAAQYPLTGYVSYLVANSPPGRRLSGLNSLLHDAISVGNAREAREVIREWYRRWGANGREPEGEEGQEDTDLLEAFFKREEKAEGCEAENIYAERRVEEEEEVEVGNGS